MSDRRRSNRYRSLTVYLPNELVDLVKEEVSHAEITQSEMLENALNFYFKELKNRTPQTIHELVALNLKKLKEVGFKPEDLLSIARGGLLPTQPDFYEIVTVLEVPKEVKENLWRKAYGNNSCNNDEKQHSKSH